MPSIAVRVPESDVADLRELVEAVGAQVEPQTAHPFDGETVVQVIIALGAGAFPFFKTWVAHRTAQRKRFSVVHDGIELKGYSAAESQRILAALTAAVSDETPDQEH